MATCPECGGSAPLGGGKTVKNAHLIYQLARELEARLKPGEEGEQARRFVQEGFALADSLHAYGHKQSMVNPDWQAAGLWTRQAKVHAGR